MILLLLALLWTIGAKLVVVAKLKLSSVAAAWAVVSAPDVIFFAVVGLIPALAYLYKPRRSVARFMLVLAAILLGWTAMNAAWLVSTGVQLQPGILLAVMYDPQAFGAIVQASLMRYRGLVVTLGLVNAGLLAWFCWRLVRPVRVIHLRTRHVRFAAGCLSAIVLGCFTLVLWRPRLDLGFEGEVLGFSSHWYALVSMAGAVTNGSREMETDRYVPRSGERMIALPSTPRESLPNVVLLLLESASYDSTSLGNPARNTTPHLEQLASEGVLFAKTRVPVSQTGKAYWACLTGTTPGIHYDYSEAILVDKPYENLATILKGCGYRSAFFEMSTGTFQCAPAVFANMGFDWAWWPENLEDPSVKLGYLAGDDFRMIEPAVSWAKDGSQPFLLMMITSVAHDPYEVPAWYGQPTGDRFEDYLQAIRYTDAFVGELRKRLDEEDLWNDTLFCVLGDHGESFRPDARRGRWVPYEEVLRIPWIIRWPTHVPAGRRVDWPCSQMDVAPTLLSLIGFDVSEAGFDGRDALTPVEPDRRLYFSSWFARSPLGFVEEDRKVVYWPYLRKVFEYDLGEDPGEKDPQLLQGSERESIIADIGRWQQGSTLRFSAKRFRKRLLFEHWYAFSSGRSAWSYYVP